MEHDGEKAKALIDGMSKWDKTVQMEMKKFKVRNTVIQLLFLFLKFKLVINCLL